MREKQPVATPTPTRAAMRTKPSAVKPTPTPTRASRSSPAPSPSTRSRPTTASTPASARAAAAREKPAPRSEPARNGRTKDAQTTPTARRALPTPASRPPPPRSPPVSAPAALSAADTTAPTASALARMARVNSELRGEARLSCAADLVLGEPPSSHSLRRTVSNISTDTEEVRRLRTQLQSVREQVHFMHKMMQGLSMPERQRLQGGVAPPLDVDKRLSFSDISPVKKTRGSVDVIVMPEEQNPFQGSWKVPTDTEHSASLFIDAPAPFARSVGSGVTEQSARERQLASKLNALRQENDELKAQLHQQKLTFESSEAELKAQVEDYAAKLAVIDAENLQLHNHVEEFEEENLRLHAALAEMANERDISAISNNQGETTGDGAVQGTEDLDDELGIEGLGEEPEDAHARCDAKIHELWQTIKTLKAYVETFRVENEDLRVQRDNAIASAERAWEENVKLAGNNNPQQKIKYVEALKQENAELIQKVRELQSKLTKKQFKRGDNNTRKDGRGSSASGSEPLEDYPSMESGDDHSDDGSYEERTKLLKKMWARNKKLEEEIDRLQKEKQALVMRQSRSPSVDSRQSKQSSTRSITRSTTQSSTTSSRWRK